MLGLLRRNLSFFLLASVAAVLLRVFFIVRFPHVDGDSFVYGQLAKNWLEHGIYGFRMASGAIEPSYIRLPGYPALLAAIWAVIGVEHYRGIMIVQLVLDLGTVFVVAAIARRVISEKAAKAAFLIAALCPFTANYVACPLTEIPEIFCTALAYYLAVRGMDELKRGGSLWWWVGSGAAVAGAIQLRPDGGLLMGAIGLYLLWWLWKRPYKRRTFTAATILAVVSLAPLLPWTVRNWRVFHELQPLAPYYANAPGEFVPLGFERWARSWIVDYVSVEDVYWAETGQEVDVDELPSRAFDSPEQRQQTSDVIDEYNAASQNLSPVLDAKFGALADVRVRTHPLRYYVVLPVMRSLDMWLRPRTEMLGLDSRWWGQDSPIDNRWSMLLGAINLLYVGAALLGWVERRTMYGALFATYLIVRSVFFGSQLPEPRYMLECYPAVFLFAAAALAGRKKGPEPAPRAGERSTATADVATD